MRNSCVKWNVAVSCILGILIFCSASLPLSNGSYAMYVWQDGWDSTVSGCSNNMAEFLAWKEKTSPCFTDNWNTAEKRDWLWSTCERVGREIGTLYLYGMDSLLPVESLLNVSTCSEPGVQLIKKTLTEGRTRIPGINIYALFSDGGNDVPESRHVSSVVWYNKNCSSGAVDRIDGVAVNNENWDRINWDVDQMTSYLDSLNIFKAIASQQDAAIGPLKTHYSVGWSWGKDVNNNDIILNWNNKTQPVMRHFIDIFDSIDVQVGYIMWDIIAQRFQTAEWEYAQQTGKTLLVNVYISLTEPCQTTFFPFANGTSGCPTWSYEYKTETRMFVELDEFQNNVTGAGVALHHFRGAYSSGGDADWPMHWTNTNQTATDPTTTDPATTQQTTTDPATTRQTTTDPATTQKTTTDQTTTDQTATNPSCNGALAGECNNNITSCTSGDEKLCDTTCYSPTTQDCFNNKYVCDVRNRLCNTTTCYDPNVQDCIDNTYLCTITFKLCGTECYDSNLYYCYQGQLTQTRK